jgi:hypothetical protein
MKIQTDLAVLDVPKSIETGFIEYCKKEGMKVEDVAIEDFLRDELDSLTGKIVPKEDAEFLATYYTSTLPSEGGHPVQGEINFEDRGIKYTAIAFGWTSELDDGGSVHMIAYKEKIGDRSTK